MSVLAAALTICSCSVGESVTTSMVTTTEGAPLTTVTPTTSTQAAASTTASIDPSPESTAAPDTTAAPEPAGHEVVAYPVPVGSHPHDVAPAADGGIWYTAQGSGELGWLDPLSGETRHISLGVGSAPHGVIVGPDGAPWITDGGLDAIVTVDPATDAVASFPLPDDRTGSNLNTASFDGDGVLWFTGQSGVYGSLDPETGEMAVYDAPEGPGPYGITTTPAGDVYYASLAGSHIAAVDAEGDAVVIEPPTPDQGARRVWSDSAGSIWVSEWNAGQVSRFDPSTAEWRSWRLPGADPQAYAVWVDDSDAVWISDFGANALVRFDPSTESFDVHPLPHDEAAVRQILGRPGEVWGAESGADHLVVVRELLEQRAPREPLTRGVGLGGCGRSSWWRWWHA